MVLGGEGEKWKVKGGTVSSPHASQYVQRRGYVALANSMVNRAWRANIWAALKLMRCKKKTVRGKPNRSISFGKPVQEKPNSAELFPTFQATQVGEEHCILNYGSRECIDR
jgi:hypothetical protein